MNEILLRHIQAIIRANTHKRTLAAVQALFDELVDERDRPVRTRVKRYKVVFRGSRSQYGRRASRLRPDDKV